MLSEKRQVVHGAEPWGTGAGRAKGHLTLLGWDQPSPASPGDALHPPALPARPTRPSGLGSREARVEDVTPRENAFFQFAKMPINA